MKKPTLGYLVDVCLAVAFFFSFLTGVLKFPNLLRSLGVVRMQSAYVSFIHDWSGVILGLLIMIHIILHWRWWVAAAKSFLGRNT
jgi:succinate dehydrogenase/fumarate reductase cytochrome b subunit